MLSTYSSTSLSLTALSGIPLVRPGDDLVEYILKGLRSEKLYLTNGDILVIAQKVVSKAEGRYERLDNVQPSKRAQQLAEAAGKDPRLVELILSESREILRYRPGVIIVVNRQGLVLANAGIDHSNVERDGDVEQVLLLPADPDASAACICSDLREQTQVSVAVIINDSIGRAWRNGTTGTAIGVAGLPALLDLKGHPDLFGEPLRVSEEAVADELAAAASLLQGQAAEGRPVVLIRGYAPSALPSPASSLIRPKAKDLFR
ncbi:uncharacterized protein METZ01_LOCUS285286 [marine metagenome]|uniref:Coenzyme F420:L-glutamate ligase-like domain-containing protein n=1 Tax=marine metagenome TaxID=408172 RepID=A0A382LBB3_9ZZZZ